MEVLQEFGGIWFWVLLAIISYVQNLFFTAVSRSRQSANLKLHAVVAVGSNFVWFFCSYFLLFPMIFKTIMDQNFWMKLAVGGFYTIFTVLGSVHMMHIMLKRTKGKSKVGASKFKPDDIEQHQVNALVQLVKSAGVHCSRPTAYVGLVDYKGDVLKAFGYLIGQKP